GIEHPLVQKAISAIDAHYSDPHFTTRTLAEVLGVRQSSLDVMFKKELAQTPGDWLRRVRQERAAHLLSQTTKSVKEVWSGVGYSDASTFGHHFKDCFGMAPTVYRRNMFIPLRAEMLEPIRSSPTSGIHDRTKKRGACVLIVDDDDVVSRSTHHYLNERGF